MPLRTPLDIRAGEDALEVRVEARRSFDGCRPSLRLGVVLQCREDGGQHDAVRIAFFKTTAPLVRFGLPSCRYQDTDGQGFALFAQKPVRMHAAVLLEECQRGRAIAAGIRDSRRVDETALLVHSDSCVR